VGVVEKEKQKHAVGDFQDNKDHLHVKVERPFSEFGPSSLVGI
jgi:hypothetical protein